MNQFKNTFSIEFPLLCGMMSQWHYNKSHALGFIKRVCKLSPLTNICTNNQVLKPPVNEANLVMKRLGLVDDQGEEYNKMMNMVEIEGLFVEDEPSFGEIKEAFDVFDRNRDGFIDGFELSEVLSSLGIVKLDLELCGRILCGVDRNGVGLVDIHDFVRLLEKGLA